MTSRKNLFALSFTVLLAGGCQQGPAQTSAAPMSDEQKSIYAYGAAVGKQVGQQTGQLRLTPEELEIFRSGFTDTLTGKEPAVEIEKYEQSFQQFAEARINAGAEETRKRGEDFLAAAAGEEGAVKTDSGLVYRTLTPGTGESPKATDTVRVHYEGKLTDGTVFDSSRQRGEPVEFGLDRVIPCWTEGVQRMKVGETARLVCPSSIAYGDRGAGGSIPPGATLAFEVELLDIVR